MASFPRPAAGVMRTLGRSGLQVSGLGLGCWAIGGPAWRGEKPVGWGEVNDSESIRAIRQAIELGINFFDTANVYGCGHSEQVLGQALGGRRAEAVIATKFAGVFDERTRHIDGDDMTPEGIKAACDASLRRLAIDVIDLYQFHAGGYEPAKAAAVRDVCEDLVAAGKIRWYGWSTDNPEGARVFASGKHCTAIQQRLNLFEGSAETLKVCEQFNLASINRSPLGMGLLTGKFSADTAFPDNDVRKAWNLKEGDLARRLASLAELRFVLQQGGRTLAQAALAWLWARSPATIPIPGFKTVAQVEENAGAMKFGPLSGEQMKQIDRIVTGMK